jgi:hypothetical protein
VSKRICISTNLNAGPGAYHDENVAQATALLDLSRGTPVDATHLVSGFDWSAPLRVGLAKCPCVALDCPPFPSFPAQIKPIPLCDFPACFDSERFREQVEQAALVSWYFTNHAVSEGILKGSTLWETEKFRGFLVDQFGPQINPNLVLALWWVTCLSAQLAFVLAKLWWRCGMRKTAIMYTTDPHADPNLEHEVPFVLVGLRRDRGGPGPLAAGEAPLVVMPLRALLGVKVEQGERLTATLGKTRHRLLSLSGMAWSGDENGDPAGCELLTETVIGLDAESELRRPLIAALDRAK